MFLNQKGFSLIEIVVSIGAFGLFALLVQGMLILGHSFTKSQQNLFDSLQTIATIKQNICVTNLAFKNINLKYNQSYVRNETNCLISNTCECKKDTDGACEKDAQGKVIPVVTYSREYLKLSSASSPSPLLELNIGGIEKEPAVAPAMETQVKALVEGGKINGKPVQYYKVHQDSHTMIKLNFDIQTAVGQRDVYSGYIFASRCVSNQDPVQYKKGGMSIATFYPASLKKSVLYILNGLEYKPYYFPDIASGGDETTIQCCKNGENKSTCESAVQKWIPRIYVIHLAPMPKESTSLKSKKPGMQVETIQELPEIQDLDTIWGAGFMVSMNKKDILSQTRFHLDIMFLRNTCSTSALNVQKCRPLSLGVNPAHQRLSETSEISMRDLIHPDISSCSGHSSGVDTTSVIHF